MIGNNFLTDIHHPRFFMIFKMSIHRIPG